MPTPASVATFVADAAGPVDLRIGPNGDLFYVDIEGGTIRRISYSTDQPPSSGPVAAYGFNEPSGTTVSDASGNGLDGSISGATRTASGKFGSALSFDGNNDWVTVLDNPKLDLTTALTLEAWVYPRDPLSGWNTVILKEQAGHLTYAIYGNTETNRPSGEIYTTVHVVTSGSSQLPPNTWTHLAATYDGAALRLYVNGFLASSLAISGPVVSSAGPLRFGGNSVWGEFLNGVIDEIRIYGRALSAAQIQADMNTPVLQDTSPPRHPQTLRAPWWGTPSTSPGRRPATTLAASPATTSTAPPPLASPLPLPTR
ncbi:MAG: LamG domain-containing protein [Dehalococcoidia bacterium]|nr:LamG domain-containing protein [Dehalococcoidia bacterium]